jgi:hypothetical protein
VIIGLKFGVRCKMSWLYCGVSVLRFARRRWGWVCRLKCSRCRRRVWLKYVACLVCCIHVVQLGGVRFMAKIVKKRPQRPAAPPPEPVKQPVPVQLPEPNPVKGKSDYL